MAELQSAASLDHLDAPPEIRAGIMQLKDDLVGETIEVRGIAVRSGETLSIKSEPGTYRRVTRGGPTD